MKLCRFDENRLGVVLGEQVADVSPCLDLLPPQRYPLPQHDLLIESLPTMRSRIMAAAMEAPPRPLSSVRLLSPVPNPGKIIAAPVNYTKHLQEVLNDPSLHHRNQINHIQRAGLFLKAGSSLSGPDQEVRITQPDRRTDHEIELVAVIGKKAKNVNPSEALTYVAGYCIGLDITIRGPEERSFRKSPDGYSVLGPWLTTADEMASAGDLSMELRVNGDVRQKARTRDLILGVEALVAFASSFYTLYPGDLIFTGTPEGVGPIVPGDRLEARIEGLGEMRVMIAEEAGVTG